MAKRNKIDGGGSIFAVWWSNIWNTAYLPINSNDTFDNTGVPYNVTRILTPEGNFDSAAYQEYSEPWMSAGFAIDYVFYFVMYTASECSESPGISMC